jgi:hypothetical protein
MKSLRMDAIHLFFYGWMPFIVLLQLFCLRVVAIRLLLAVLMFTCVWIPFACKRLLYENSDILLFCCIHVQQLTPVTFCFRNRRG